MCSDWPRIQSTGSPIRLCLKASPWFRHVLSLCRQSAFDYSPVSLKPAAEEREIYRYALAISQNETNALLTLALNPFIRSRKVTRSHSSCKRMRISARMRSEKRRCYHSCWLRKGQKAIFHSDSLSWRCFEVAPQFIVRLWHSSADFKGSWNSTTHSLKG